MDIQFAVIISTIIITLLSAALAALLTETYIKKRAVSHLFWSAGIWLFAISALLEVVFAFGLYSQLLIKTYLLMVSLLVEFLAMGSIMLVKNRIIKYAYSVFAAASAVIVAYFLITTNIGNIISEYVVYGVIPPMVIVSSSVATFPAAIVIIAVAALSYLKTRNKKMLSIILGVIIVSIAGTLYIVQFPAALYFAEFIGILLLWIGFYDSKK